LPDLPVLVVDIGLNVYLYFIPTHIHTKYVVTTTTIITRSKQPRREKKKRRKEKRKKRTREYAEHRGKKK